MPEPESPQWVSDIVNAAEDYADELGLASILEAHRPYGLDCKCGRPINSDKDWAWHMSDVLRGLKDDVLRQVYRQIALFMEDGQRERLIVAQAILDPRGCSEDEQP